MKEALHAENTLCDFLIVKGRLTFKGRCCIIKHRGEPYTVLRVARYLPGVVVYLQGIIPWATNWLMGLLNINLTLRAETKQNTNS